MIQTTDTPDTPDAPYRPDRAISAASYNSVRRRIESWTKGEFCTTEQMLSLSDWLRAEVKIRKAND